MPWRQGNQIRLLENGEQFFPQVFAAIRRARERVLIETFILFNDKVGKALHKVLLAAAQRGVRVTLMVDGYGSAGLPDDFVSTLTASGVRFLYYDPRPLFMGVRTNLFRRLHRKVVVCDNDIAFVGGINFSYEHLSEFGTQAKQDYAVKVKGPIVDDIAGYTEAAMNNPPPAGRRWGRLRIPSDKPAMLRRVLSGVIIISTGMILNKAIWRCCAVRAGMSLLLTPTFSPAITCYGKCARRRNAASAYD